MFLSFKNPALRSLPGFMTPQLMSNSPPGNLNVLISLVKAGSGEKLGCINLGKGLSTCRSGDGEEGLIRAQGSVPRAVSLLPGTRTVSLSTTSPD